MYNRENPSQDYKELVTQYQILHTKGLKDRPGNAFFNGISLAVHIERLTKLMLLEGVKSLLDYGCGKALLYDDMKYKEMPIDENGQVLPKPLSKLWQLDYFSLYDPAYEKYSKLPKGKYDAVICTDVIEHIDEKDVDWILDEIFSYARKFVFVTIACYKALKKFEDGRNLHVNVKQPSYWKEKLLKLHNKYSHLNIHYSLDIIKDEDAENPQSLTVYKTIERK
tara:strand:+ start:31 stop:699 length:669 start_codon:yes stop_codon:yes gene_type:complete